MPRAALFGPQLHTGFVRVQARQTNHVFFLRVRDTPHTLDWRSIILSDSWLISGCIGSSQVGNQKLRVSIFLRITFGLLTGVIAWDWYISFVTEGIKGLVDTYCEEH